MIFPSPRPDASLARSPNPCSDAARGGAALADLADFPITRYPHDVFVPRVWALRANLTAYDAVYVALAEALDAPLLTCDARLANAAGHGARIVLA